jgi:hypothetical protein
VIHLTKKIAGSSAAMTSGEALPHNASIQLENALANIPEKWIAVFPKGYSL